MSSKRLRYSEDELEKLLGRKAAALPETQLEASKPKPQTPKHHTPKAIMPPEGHMSEMAPDGTITIIPLEHCQRLNELRERCDGLVQVVAELKARLEGLRESGGAIEGRESPDV